jgi:phosphoenolpyruvate---glycerone phosphotransferase subunit DhaM
MSRVAVVLVSHSGDIARGTARLAAQMAPDVLLLPAGGLPGAAGEHEQIGTSVEVVMAAIEEGLTARDGEGSGVVVLTDLGSAVLTADLVLEMLDETEAVVVPPAPIVEGAVAAAVVAQQGGDLTAVADAAVSAGRDPALVAIAPGVQGTETPAPSEQASATVTLRNPLGLHARTAAVVARAAAEQDAQVMVEGADATSVLALMTLGATGGQVLTVTAQGVGAQTAVEAIVALIDSGFGES